jgi:phosphorylase kinase alpha/beta subunit
MRVIHNDQIRKLVRPRYTDEQVREILLFLRSRGSLDFVPLPTGVFPAATVGHTAAQVSGYDNVWVRDNVYVSFAHEVGGHGETAAHAMESIATYFRKYRHRFEGALEGQADAWEPMNRPEVRFDGLRLEEIPGHWAHAQNDALGYFLWLYCRLAQAGHLVPDGALLGLFAAYFEALRYWEDEDSGHWEEARKVEASSIGTVVAGLKALRGLLVHAPELQRSAYRGGSLTADYIDHLIQAGEHALTEILPAECVQPDKHRRYDAALLFLVYPLEVVEVPMAEQIVQDVLAHLQGEHGIRRYLGDSYWTADYKDKLPPERRTSDFSERMEERDALARPGEEAQWCIFDPIVSTIYGGRYLRSGDPEDLERQVHFLNRALSQLTGPDCPQGELRCPEAYYLERGRYVPNDHVPLLWTQANLWLALVRMEESARRGAR